MKPPFSFVHTFSALSAVALLAGTQQAKAATYVWVGGGGNANWSTTGNWFTDTSNSAPYNPDTAAVAPPANPTIPSGTITKTTPADPVDTIVLRGATQNAATVDSAWYIESLVLDSVAPFTLSGPGNLTIRPGDRAGNTHDGRLFLTNGSASLKTITNNIKVLPAFTGNSDGSGISVGSGSMILSGALDVMGLSGVRVLGGSGSVTIDGAVSSNTGWAINSGSTLVLTNAANAFNGQGMTVWSGVLKIANTGAAGGIGGLTMSNSGNSTFKSTILTTGAANITPNIGIAAAYVWDTSTSKPTTEFATIGTEGTGVTNFNGNIVNGNTATVDVDPTQGGVNNQLMSTARAMQFTAAANGRVNFNGTILRAGAATGSLDTVNKKGDGIVAINGTNNNWLGQTTVDAGTLLVNGTLQAAASSLVIVSSSTTLGGAGAINRDVIFSGGSRLSAGNMSETTGASLVGTLTMGGGIAGSYVEIEPSSILYFDLGTASDKIVINGNLNIGSGTPTTLNILDSGGFGAGTYELFDYSGDLTYTPGSIIVGTTPNSAYTYEISTTGATGGSISLIVSGVPEPGRAVLLMLGCASLLMRRKRKGATLSPALA